jgi:hypothetical protein
MSDLQLSLMIIGILIVVATYLFKWLQERKYRRKSETAFRDNLQDVLLEPQGAGGAVDGRVEPQWREPAIVEKSSSIDKPAGDRVAEVLDPEIMFIVEISRNEPFPPDAIKTLLKYLLEIGRRVICLGYLEKKRNLGKT